MAVEILLVVMLIRIKLSMRIVRELITLVILTIKTIELNTNNFDMTNSDLKVESIKVKP